MELDETNPNVVGATNVDGVYIWKRNDTLGVVECADGTTHLPWFNMYPVSETPKSSFSSKFDSRTRCPTS